MTIPRTSDLLALSISAPNDHSGRIRELLPTLLEGMTVNRVMMDSGVLDSLPQTLAFPQ